MAAGSIVGSFIGGRLLGVVPSDRLVPAACGDFGGLGGQGVAALAAASGEWPLWIDLTRPSLPAGNGRSFSTAAVHCVVLARGCSAGAVGIGIEPFVQVPARKC